MKFTKILGVVAVAAFALMAFASSASATTLATKGVGENAEVKLKATLAPGASALLTDTFNFTANTCTTSTVEGHTVSPFTVDPGAIGGPIDVLSWSNCTDGNPVVEEKEGKKLNGSLSVEYIAGTTNGTVRSTGAAVNVPTSVFGTITCKTNNTDIGTLNGKKEGTATFTINAVLECTGIGTARWSGTYTITSPTNLSVET